MKKTLLFAAAAMTAASAMAELTDVTPKAYNFDSGLELPFFNPYTHECSALAWNPSSFVATKYPELYKDGLIMWVGPGINDNWTSIVNGVKIVDLGGEVGKVLCFGGMNSDAESALAARGQEITLPKFETSPGYLIPLWHADPKVTDAMANGVERACRIRIVLNVFQNDPGAQETHFQPYLQTGSNGTLGDNETTTRAVYASEFCYNWGEIESENLRIDWSNPNPDDLALYSTADGDVFTELGQGDAGYVWNPNRWMVYEFDVPFMGENAEDPATSEAPIKIKMEMPELNGATVFIKSVQFLMKDAGEEAIPELSRRKTWKYMDVDVNTASIEGIVNDAAAGMNVAVDGNKVTFAEAADVFTITGAKVATVAAGQSIDLAAGFYVAASNGKSVKFVVK